MYFLIWVCKTPKTSIDSIFYFYFFLATSYTIFLTGISLDDVNTLSDPINDFTNALNEALGGSNGNDIYDVTFVDNNGFGVDVTYIISSDLGSNVSTPGFENILENSIRNQPGLQALFRKQK